MSVDVTPDLFVAGEATTATTPDAGVLPALLEADPMAVPEVTADTRYGDAATRKALGHQGIELVAPAPPASAKKGYFSKDAFDIDLEAGTVTCPAGQVATIPMTKAGRRQARFAASTCQACPLASQCTKRAGGRTIDVNADEALLAPARKARWTKQFRQRYGQRRPSARTLSSSTATPSWPWRGHAKADAWLKLRMAALNLDHLGKMPGLIY